MQYTKTTYHIVAEAKSPNVEPETLYESFDTAKKMWAAYNPLVEEFSKTDVSPWVKAYRAEAITTTVEINLMDRYEKP